RHFRQEIQADINPAGGALVAQPRELRHVISHHKNRGGKTHWRYRCLRVSGAKAACKYSRQRRRGRNVPVQGLSFTLNRDHWISDNWEDEPVEETLASQVASLLKRSKSHQFYGLMGKRSEVVQPVKMERRRHKGDMFVGLMGKRSLGGDFRKTIPESSTAMDKSGDLNKQTADVRDEWDRLQYY
ncbi:hypothetical protein QQF64_004317, partial [Cirrhinus molitorella]